MNYATYREYLQHPKFLEIRKKRLDFAGNQCEICNKQALEVHHRRYPKWGTFDDISNIIAVCHACHCKIHGKEN